MPKKSTLPTDLKVLTFDAIRWGIDTLGGQRLHPTFVVYLYLRAQSRAGKLSEASATSRELLALIEMPGNPSKPYYFPLIDRGKRTGVLLPTFWRATNIAGSWSPGSIHRLLAGAWLASEDGKQYAMPDNHVDLALAQMLYGAPVSALAMAAYFLRNDGFFLSPPEGPDDLIEAFRRKFDFPAAADEEFAKLFVVDVPTDIEFEWFEPATPAADAIELVEEDSDV